MQFYCFYGLFYIAFTSKINYFYYLCIASLNLKNIDCQDEVVQKGLKEGLYIKQIAREVKYEEILDDNDSRAYYGVMWR